MVDDLRVVDHVVDDPFADLRAQVVRERFGRARVGHLDLERRRQGIRRDISDLEVGSLRGDVLQPLERLLLGHVVDARDGRVRLDARFQRERLGHLGVVVDEQRELDLALQHRDRRLEAAICRHEEREEREHQGDRERRREAHRGIAQKSLGRGRPDVEPAPHAA